MLHSPHSLASQLKKWLACPDRGWLAKEAPREETAAVKKLTHLALQVILDTNLFD